MPQTEQLTVKVTSQGIQQAQKQLDSLAKSAKVAEVQNTKLSKSFTVQKGAAQQAAFQIQDFAVQVGAGTSAVTAFAQQAPQLLSVFGAGGAILGAITAVTAAIAGPFLISLFDTEDQLEKLNSVLKETDGSLDTTKSGVIALSDEFGKLAAQSRAIAEGQLVSEILKLEKAIEDSGEAAKDFADDLTGFINRADLDVLFSDAAVGVEFLNQQFRALSGELELTEEQGRRLGETFRQFGADGDIKALAESVNELFQTIEDPSDELVEFRDNISQLAISTLSAEERIKALREEQAKLAGSTDVVTKSIIEQNEAEIKRLDTIRKVQDATRDRDREQAERFLAQLDLQNATELERIEIQQQAKLDRLQDFYDRGLISYEEYLQAQIDADTVALDKQIELEQKAADERARIDEREAEDKARNQREIFDSGIQLLQLFGDEQSKAQKTALIAAQLFAEKDLIIKQSQAVANAWASAPFPANLGAVAATLAGFVPLFSAVAGAREQGGQMNAGQPYLVGERGPEVVIPGGNSRVINQQQMGGAGGGRVPVTIINQTSARIDQAEAQQMDDGRVVAIVRETVSGDFNNPNSQISKNLDRTRNTQRR